MEVVENSADLLLPNANWLLAREVISLTKTDLANESLIKHILPANGKGYCIY